MAENDLELSGLGDQDLFLFAEGTHSRLYEKLGAQLAEINGQAGTRFVVWAPEAESVSVVGDFNDWNAEATPLSAIRSSGLWAGFAPGVGAGAVYKYHVRSRHQGYWAEKADPFARMAELPPATASVVWSEDYAWSDGPWMAGRGARQGTSAPMSVYEVHLGSWMRAGAHGENMLSYRDLADRLADYLEKTQFTHVELLPVTEHPFYGSWGYQTTGYFAPTRRFGTPADLKYLVNRLHEAGFGVILDWVPSHFPTDLHGLAYFDGSHLYEHADPRLGFHPDWNSAIFNYGRHEVRSFLLSSACYWLDHFHLDGLRVDAVASMLYLNYSRKPGEWIPNKYGGHENLEAMAFLRDMNRLLHERFPDALTIAEESTAWPKVSRSVDEGGLGFDFKWDMGWMHDTLKYMARDPVYRQYHHHELTFRGLYAFTESYILPLSHDEVVHGKGPLIDKMPGDEWQRFANLRLLFAYMHGLPGKKLCFQGGELGQTREWSHEQSVDWHLLDEGPFHKGVQALVGDLNRIHREFPALHRLDASPEGYQWIEGNDGQRSVLAFLRKSDREEDALVLCAFNFTPVVREAYRIGVPFAGRWREIVNSDAAAYGGSGQGNMGGVETTDTPSHGHGQSLLIRLPPLAALFFVQDT
ncbi:MAG: 1,4-alpha-glucan branching protein GlgB [Myxococcota bacterium]